MNTQLSVLNVRIRSLDGLYSLNDLHKVAGSERKHEPNLFFRLDQTQELIKEIQSENSDTQICVSYKSLRTGQNKGTWACEELVLAYATWISPKFHLIVLRAFLNLHKNRPHFYQALLHQSNNKQSNQRYNKRTIEQDYTGKKSTAN